MTIQWFPGHMAKARREVTEKLKLVDIMYELVDARIPFSSRNPMIDEIIGEKQRIVLLTKSDMADKEMTNQWIRYFEAKGLKAIAINSQAGTGLHEIVKTSNDILKEKFERMKARGLKKPRAIRAMIVGIPNVGKSTLINKLAKKNIARTGNTPGVTKSQQWIKVGKELELLDTPGILWPKFEDQEVGYKLALTGAIKDTILNLQDIAVFGIRFIEKHYPERLKDRFGIEPDMEILDVFDTIGKLRGCLRGGGEVDYDKTAELIIRDIRSEKIGPLTFDLPEQINMNEESEN
ncbi:ribosome biogenesis GTPase YlqF [Falsibacillus pallidus]|uniref:Ribosome biogenesis GTPase A n=1 Tax=Falsibacillus pallidus TaxID=493781 RepID=A0A370GUX4_9BACI|nr:ribosome biogenesis GTPase YlqF [Falsibacillus pallidus]RDI47478.1 ribosome biogenesis GTPase A [Falsibacillus pallidus]